MSNKLMWYEGEDWTALAENSSAPAKAYLVLRDESGWYLQRAACVTPEVIQLIQCKLTELNRAWATSKADKDMLPFEKRHLTTTQDPTNHYYTWPNRAITLCTNSTGMWKLHGHPQESMSAETLRMCAERLDKLNAKAK
jgi:hypothetical protein